MTIARTGPQSAAVRGLGEIPGGDLYDGLRCWRLWTMLGSNDIRRRYRRSVLGPFWMTISMSLLVAALGSLYAHIFHSDLAVYVPYLALGFTVWTFISMSVKDSCHAFWLHGEVIKQFRVPFSVHVLRVVWSNFLVLLHTIIVIVPIWIYFRHWPGLAALMALPGIAVVGLNLVWVGLVVAVLNTRFRDIAQMVETALQIAVFATPIMWPMSALGERTFIADFNPIHHMIELVRAPLLGQTPDVLSWIVALASAAVGCVLAALLLWRVERRIVYWL